jgi:hypothetical protein
MNVMKASLLGMMFMFGLTAYATTHRSMREANAHAD